MDEILDVYNEAHEIIKTGVPRGSREKLCPGEFFLVCHVCIFSPSGRLLVQKRAKNKDYAPGRYDVSAGGFVKSGESAQDAAVREVKEELGFSIGPDKLSYIGCFSIPYVLDDFYLFRVQGECLPEKLPDGEVDSVRWMNCEEVFEALKTGGFVEYSADLIDYVFAYYDRISG